jgi:hypothetical protein
LDLNGDQTCQNCPAGTYSLGGGVRFDDWETIPETFSVTSSKVASSFMYFEHQKPTHADCTRLVVFLIFDILGSRAEVELILLCFFFLQKFSVIL